MASPLSVLRKHQKVLLVVFGVTLMVVFLVGSFLPTGTGGSSPTAGENPVVVTWDGGKLTRMELDMLRYRHFQAMRFLEELMARGIRARGNAYRDIFLRIDPLADPQSDVDRNFLDEQILNRVLFAELAAKEGIVISDAYLDGYLMQVAGGSELSRAEIEAINRAVNRGEIGVASLRRHLKMELAAQMMFYLADVNVSRIPSPLETAQRFNQINRRIDCEVIGLPIENYVSQVSGQPSESTLRELFKQGQGDFPDPTGRKPGFKLPRRFALQYFTGSVESFLVNEMNKLTDKEVQEEYERRVQANDPLVYEDLFGGPAPGVDDKPLDDSGNRLPGDESDQQSGDNDAQNEANQTGNAESDKTQKDDADQGDGSGSGDGLMLTSFAPQDEQDAEGKESGTQQQESDSQNDQSQQETGAGSQESQAAQDAQVPPTESAGEQKAAEQQTDEAPGSDPTAQQTPQRRVKPLAEVADRIKRAMKTDAATKALETAIVEADGEVRTFVADLRDWETDEPSRRGTKPTPPDFKAIADRLNLQFESTELIDLATFAEMEIAQAYDTSIPAQLLQLVAFRFTDSDLYQPFRFRETLAGREILFWYQQKEDSRERDFAEAREDVLEFWRQQQAMDAALKEAERIASEANSSGKTLAELDKDRAQSTGEFSYYNWYFQSINIGSPANVDTAGEDFMDAAFSLSPGQATTALNDRGNIVYVIRMISDASAGMNMNDVLYQRMVNLQRLPDDAADLMVRKEQDVAVEWIRDFRDSLNVRWKDR